MNQVTQGESSTGLSVHSLKRRRGRPRKDPSLKQTATAHVPPGFERVKEHLPLTADRTDAIDCMVGQAVTGVIEATFDAGYLIAVRIGSSTTNLRGVVFKPGHFVPVTAENDVAPHLQMIRRNDVNPPSKNQGWSRRQKLAIRTANMVPSKRRYASPKAAPSVPPVGVRGTVVPVVLQPVNISNRMPTSNQIPSEAFQSAHMMAFGDKDVHVVEPLAVLPPDRSIPVSQMFLGTQPHTSCHVSQGSEQNDNKPFDEGTSEVGQGENIKPMESTDIDNPGSSETSDTQTESSKEALNSSPEDSGVVSKQETSLASQPFSTESLHAVSIPKPFFNYGTGRMTELLQALQENMKENQVQIAEQPTSAPKSEASVP